MDYESLIKNPPKKRVNAPLPATQQAPSAADSAYERNRQTALHHAGLLQERKDVEAKILNSLEELIDFPTSSGHSNAKPSTEDVTRFRELISPFQVSDYDALIEERVAASRCAYVFCPKPLKKGNSKDNSFRLVWGSGKGNELQIVSSEKYETWCSKACAKRAMFIKVQLNETPAWERASVSSKTQIELLDETEDDEQISLQQHISRLTLDDGDVEGRMKEDMEQLAYERGESTQSAKPSAVMTGKLKENLHTKAPKAPSLAQGGRGNAIEGYVPRIGVRTDHRSMADGEDEEDHDWKLS